MLKNDKKMKQIAITKTLSYYFTDSTETNSGALDEKFEKLHHEMIELFEKYGVQMAESGTSYYGIEKFSIEHCESCEKVMINRDKNPSGFGNSEYTYDLDIAIINGGDLNGKSLCEECLPITHRWGLHS